MKRLAGRMLAAWFVAGCGGESGSAAADAGAPHADGGRDGPGGDAPAPTYTLDPGLPDTTALGTRRGLRVVRGIIHLHTVYSHDACDGMPELEPGVPDEQCNEDLRAGLCATRQDFAMTTDHEDLAAAVDYEDLLLLREGDEAIEAGGAPVANSMDCGDGFRPLLLPGGEFGLMPVGMEAHAPGTPEERAAIYEEESAVGAEAEWDVGAVVLQAHMESKDVSLLGSIPVDGVEVWNLHAAIDPDNRKLLELDPAGAIEGVVAFAGQQPTDPHPDLALIGFLEEQQLVLDKWDTLTAARRTVGVAATDAHRNALPLLLRDGERGDSYRRTMRWFANHLLVDEGWESDPRGLKDSLRAGRAYVAFEVLGTPVGFDFRAEAGGDIYEMGDTAPAGAEIVVARPTVYGWDGAVEATTTLLRVTAGGTEEVVSVEGDELRFTADEAGAYRAAIHLRPTHLLPYLGEDPSAFDHDYVWIYANPIFVE